VLCAEIEFFSRLLGAGVKFTVYPPDEEGTIVEVGTRNVLIFTDKPLSGAPKVWFDYVGNCHCDAKKAVEYLIGEDV